MTDWSWEIKEREFLTRTPKFLTYATGWKMTEDTKQGQRLFSRVGRITSSIFSLIWFEVSLRHPGLNSYHAPTGSGAQKKV